MSLQMPETRPTANGPLQNDGPPETLDSVPFHKLTTEPVPVLNGASAASSNYDLSLRSDSNSRLGSEARVPTLQSPSALSPSALAPQYLMDDDDLLQRPVPPIRSSSGSPGPSRQHEHDSLTPPVTRKNVQFQNDASDLDYMQDGHETPPSATADRGEHGRSQSIAAKLRDLARWQSFTHTRSTSGVSGTGRSVDGKELDGRLSTDLSRPDPLLAATIEEGDSDAHHADASAEESAAEPTRQVAAARKRRRKSKKPGDADTAPTSPQGPAVTEMRSDPTGGTDDRIRPLLRSATDVDAISGHQGLSEDEGRKQSNTGPSWTPRHPLRGLSYAAPRRPGEDGAGPREGFRQLTRLHLTHTATPRDATGTDTPKTSRRKLLAERSATATNATAQKWRQVANRLRLIGQTRKKERTQDHQKSAELLAELAAGSPAALMLASMFQRDEHNTRRIPVLLEQLKIQVTDSEVETYKDHGNPTPGDKHLIFRIELEYGSGINRMKWVVKRSLRDFTNLHLRYKAHYGSEKLKGRGESYKQMPKFPRSVFPYKALQSLMDEDEEEGDDTVPENEAGATDNEAPRPLRRTTSFGLHRRRSSTGGNNDNNPNGPLARTDPRFKERQKKRLEAYLQAMVKFMLFRADSNRLCKFLEISALGVRLAAEGSYHGKEGFLLIRSAKGLDFRKTLTPSNIENRHTPKWFLVRHSYVVCVDSPEEMHIYDVFLFDSEFKMQSSKIQSHGKTKEFAEGVSEAARHPQHHRLKLSNSERRLKLLARNERQLLQFEESIRLMVEQSPWSKPNRFDSFAPVRPNCFAQWLVDGRDYTWVVSRAINQAKDVIYIHDWWLSPEIYMRRPPAISQKWRLDRLLKRKAEEGVKIFVIVYRNIESAIPIDSQYTKFSLLDLHPNVFVQRSPNQFRQNTFFWAHHEKICIVDHTIAFVGGIDLCFGRWDTPQHTLIDDKPTGFEKGEEPRDADHCQLWPGKDYSNPRIQDFYALNKPYEEMYDRQRIARMPWHDIAMQVVGQPARDLTRHFVQRWNYILRQRKPTRPTPFLLPPPDFNAAELEALGLDGTCEVQILRSAGPWSLGTPEKTEHSIMNAYVKMIEESDHFVYIENQFFISSCTTEGATVHNKIGDALVERINRAFKNDEHWRAIILIPLIPGFQNTVEQEGGTSVRLIMQYQYRSICRGESSIFGRLRSLGIEPEEYIQFYALRQWGKIGPQQALVSEQLYIHAKCMIVDDRVAIIGSANINERSMLGNRDSEAAAVVRDTDMLWSTMNGKPYQVGRFPHSLRMRLMREHLGLDVDKIMEEAQVMEAERKRTEQADTSAIQSPTSPTALNMGSLSSPTDSVDLTTRERESELRSELLDRNEKLQSFNHDVDWEQHGNPNLRANRKLTEDNRVTGTDWHRDDLAGHGVDNMAEIYEEGYTSARDTVSAKGARELLVSNIHPEGKTSLQHPRAAGTLPRLPTYVLNHETANPPLPPRPAAARMNTAALGLPMLSQLPPLPIADDTDIGGPPLDQSDMSANTKSNHPLLGELKRPLVDRDVMADPILDTFIDDTWHQIAENNTKIYRTVFRPMPDNQVRDWKDYQQYLAYEQRFEQLQGHDPNAEEKAHKAGAAGGAVSRSGPPGTAAKLSPAQLKNLADVPAELAKAPGQVLNLLSGVVGDVTGQQASHVEKEHLRQWAADANQAQENRQHKSLRRKEDDPLDEKAALKTVPEDSSVSATTPNEDARKSDDDISETTNSSPPTSSGLEKERTSQSSHSVTFSDAINHNNMAISSSQPVRRRRRATTRSSRRDFNASDDIMSVDEAEELLGCVQGHLVIWPYDWLDKVEAGGNWLFPFDQISPIEI